MQQNNHPQYSLGVSAAAPVNRTTALATRPRNHCMRPVPSKRGVTAVTAISADTPTGTPTHTQVLLRSVGHSCSPRTCAPPARSGLARLLAAPADPSSVRPSQARARVKYSIWCISYGSVSARFPVMSRIVLKPSAHAWVPRHADGSGLGPESRNPFLFLASAENLATSGAARVSCRFFSASRWLGAARVSGAVRGLGGRWPGRWRRRVRGLRRRRGGGRLRSRSRGLCGWGRLGRRALRRSRRPAIRAGW